MTLRMLTPLVMLGLLVVAAQVATSKVPLQPEELEAASKLIVTGRVESHETEDRRERDGSVIRYVNLTVRVEAVAKGEGEVNPGQTIPCHCWVVVKEPPQGDVWDPGQRVIPGDGGRARFYLDYRTGGGWHVIHPNGVELLDATPPLKFDRARPNLLERTLAGTSVWLVIGSVAVLAGLVAAFLIIGGKVRTRI